MEVFTRLMACDKNPPPGVHIVPDTHVHPNYAVHPRTKDSYSPYNKPYSIITGCYILETYCEITYRGTRCGHSISQGDYHQLCLVWRRDVLCLHITGIS